MSIEQVETAGPHLPPDKPEVGAYPAQCPVIGLGASAGGLEAFQNFLHAVPADSGHAYVLVQHLDPIEFDPFGQSDRITLNGPAVELPPKHALAMTLTLHELATNAAKYGALSDRGGTLDVSWAVNMDGAGRRLVLDWVEHCAKPCSIPTGEGFGMQLIKNAVPHDLQGRCDHQLLPEGVKCRIAVPF